MSTNAKDLEKLVPGSTLDERNGMLVWTAPKGGHILSGKKQKGSGGQSEGQESLFTIQTPFWFRGTKESPWYFEDQKDGIKFREENWKLTWCHFRRPGEDAITAMAGSGWLEDCTFEGNSSSDKLLQLNVADLVTVKRCKFFHCITAIQCGLQKYAKPHHSTNVVECAFDDVECAIKAVVGRVLTRKNKYHDGDCELIEVAGGRIVEN